MNNSIQFTCTRLAGTNKVGELKQNEKGYWPMVVGALNMFNSAGMYYRYDAAREFFEGTSELMRRVKRGALRGEYGHPRKELGMSPQQYFARLLQIHEDKVCCHHADLKLDFENFKDEQGRPVIAILSEVCPSGMQGHVLERQLKNPRENVCFSVRSFTEDVLQQGVMHRYIRKLVTFDYVNEPGMSIAEKYYSPALESLEETSFTRGQVEMARRHIASDAKAVGNESVVVDVDGLCATMGWDSQVLKANTGRLVESAWGNW